ncbi:BTAD domain-containing putative transcriptional regulator [Actinomadura litoris]|uniref:Tetratricopeptide repeat protein n=1 Tax=Actinomadura litoris TaxID=2678616 RepID=A0A7K1KV19_9ACTN|nr:BTAD domain-containing putative transcriptional regulator [Actinomadura litoris]MUN35796.1 tetratricopeptide repeat protein [Actinomadura litoris]
MRFGILGDTRAWRGGGDGGEDGGEDEVPLGGPARRAVLALLLTRPGEVVSAGRLAEGAASPGGHALQAQVSRLRAALGADAPIERVGDGYRIIVSPDAVDACRFERLAADGRAALRDGATGRAADLLRDALALWRGPALADLPTAVTADAVRLEERRVAAIEDRFEADLRLGRHRAAVPELRELTVAHPLRERLAALLVRALRDGGDRAEALAVFERTRRRLADELGADPSPELTALHAALLRADPVPAAPPAQLTSFVGRGAEMTGVGRLLSANRLVTLHGPGGVGKTRLAVEVAAQTSSAVGEVCFVELAPLRDPAGLPRALLGALGLREGGLRRDGPREGGGDAAERLAAALSGRALLLVLDNCEHLVAGVAALAARLLAASPDLRVLATSREPLGITGEHLWPVRPLDGDAAVRLFTERAEAVRPGVAGDPGTIRRICAALDDLPLAIELAAARTRTLDLADLASRLDDRLAGRLGVPTRGARTADERHRTLRSVVAWSWDLLTADERRAASRFTVFAGGASAASARRLCGDAALESLTDRSLLEFAGGRYRMLETIRAYGAERLDPADGIGREHACHYLALAEDADPHLRRAEQLEWLPVLAADHDNLLAALHWAAGTGETRLALRLCAALSHYLWIRGLSASAASDAATVLAELGPHPPDGLDEEYVTCVLLAAYGDGAWVRHRPAAEAALARTTPRTRYPSVPFLWLMRNADGPAATAAYAIATGARDEGDPWALAAARFVAGFPRLASGDTGGAGREFTASADGFRALGDRWGTALALDALAGLAALRGDRARAIALTDEALALTERVGALDESADLLVNRGDHRVHGDVAGARADYRRAAALARRAGSPTTLAAALRGLGDLALRDGDLAEARRLYEDALGRFAPNWVKSVGHRVGALVGLGRVAAAHGDHDTARARFREAVASAERFGASGDGARGVEALAALAAAEGDPESHARLLGAAAALRGVPGPDAPGIDPAYAAAHAGAARLGRADALRLAGLPEPLIAELTARQANPR